MSQAKSAPPSPERINSKKVALIHVMWLAALVEVLIIYSEHIQFH